MTKYSYPISSAALTISQDQRETTLMWGFCSQKCARWGLNVTFLTGCEGRCGTTFQMWFQVNSVSVARLGQGSVHFSLEYVSFSRANTRFWLSRQQNKEIPARTKHPTRKIPYYREKVHSSQRERGENKKKRGNNLAQITDTHRERERQTGRTKPKWLGGRGLFSTPLILHIKWADRTENFWLVSIFIDKEI